MNSIPGVVLDPTFLRKSFGGDLEVEKIIYETFLGDVMPRWEQMRLLLDGGHYSEIKKIVHSSKPSFSFVGLPALLPEIETFQQLLEYNPLDTAALSERYIEIYRKMVLVQPQIEERIRFTTVQLEKDKNAW